MRIRIRCPLSRQDRNFNRPPTLSAYKAHHSPLLLVPHAEPQLIFAAAGRWQASFSDPPSGPSRWIVDEHDSYEYLSTSNPFQPFGSSLGVRDDFLKHKSVERSSASLCANRQFFSLQMSPATFHGPHLISSWTIFKTKNGRSSNAFPEANWSTLPSFTLHTASPLKKKEKNGTETMAVSYQTCLAFFVSA